MATADLGCEEVSGAGQSAQSEPGHGQIMFGLAKQPLDLFAITGRLVISFGSHQGAGMIAGVLVDVSWDSAMGRFGTAFVLQGTRIAVIFAGPVVKRVTAMDLVIGL